VDLQDRSVGCSVLDTDARGQRTLVKVFPLAPGET
jgi:hypothetical protein